MYTETDYGLVLNKIIECAAKIRLLICDVDGVLSNGLIYMGNQGEELKTFHVRDGYGIRYLKKSGVEVAIITACNSKLIKNRAQTLSITHLYQGQMDKSLAYKELLTKLNYKPKQVAYIGDDLIDLSVMNEVGLSIAVADAHPVVRKKSHYITSIKGGNGAVREVCDLILFAQKNEIDS